MVDVAAKDETERVARASGRIRMRPATIRQVVASGAAKGDVLGVARVAAIQAAKRTAALIPLCHPLAITHVGVDFAVNRKAGAVECTAIVATRGRTGVEMEALTAVAVGLLTVYDMLKAVDRGMTIEGIALLEKKGGRSGHWVGPPRPRRR
jgi:cyclic pyranopterin monophosphate synthase